MNYEEMQLEITETQDSLELEIVDAVVNRDFARAVLDVKENGVSVVDNNRCANVTVPTNVSDLTNDLEYQTSDEVAASIAEHNTSLTAHENLFEDYRTSVEQDVIDTGISDTLSLHMRNVSNPHRVNKSQLGLSNVDNTSDLNKPISTATQSALDLKANQSDLVSLTSRVSTNETNIAKKVDKVEGKGLSTNDFTDAMQTKLYGIQAHAQVNVQADWNEEDDTDDSYIKNKPELADVALSGSYDDLFDKPSIPTKTSDLTNDSGFITKAVDDLINYTKTSDLKTVALTGSYNDLTNKPVLVTNLENGIGTTSLQQLSSTSLSNNSIALGSASVAGSKACSITSVSNDLKTFTFNSVEDVVVGYEGNLYINDGNTDNNYMMFGKVASISGNDIIFDTAITWTGGTSLVNSYIWFTGHPEIGDITIGTGAMSQGFNTNAAQIGSHSEGINTIALGKYSHAEGNGSVAGGYCSHAEGRDTKTKGLYAFASGRASEGNGDYSFAGIQGKANGANSLAIGTTVESNGNYSIALGHQSYANGNESVSIGNTSTASGSNSVAIGKGNTSSGQYSASLNADNTSSGYASLAVGTGTTASGSRAFSTGYQTEASGTTAFAGGASSKAMHDASVAFGTRCQTSRNNQVVIGRDNTDDTNALFIIGNGTSQSSKRNVFEVKDNNGLCSIIVGNTELHEDNIITKSEAEQIYVTNTTFYDALDAKQNTLVSGTNIKTINNSSILGSGNISLPTSSDLANYVAKSEATGYNDILTQTSAASTYLTQTNAASTYLTQSNASSTYVAKSDAVGYDDILTETEASSIYLTQTNAAATYQTKNLVVNNIQVSGTPQTLSAYNSWDTNNEYGYYIDVAVTGLTADMIITNFIADTAMMSRIAQYVVLQANGLRLFTTTSASFSYTIYTLSAMEVL